MKTRVILCHFYRNNFVHSLLKIDFNNSIFIFFIYFRCEKDNLENTLKRYLNLKDYSHKEHKGQGLYVSFKLLHGDIKQVLIKNIKVFSKINSIYLYNFF